VYKTRPGTLCLGDAVLGLVTSHWLFDRYPARAEGELAKLKSFLVSAPALSRIAERAGARRPPSSAPPPRPWRGSTSVLATLDLGPGAP
jgi:dsRNA-specific ribonuclease